MDIADHKQCGCGCMGYGRFMTLLRTLIAAAVLALAAPTSALAIVGGAPDGNGHPNVGLLLNPDMRPECTVTLVAPSKALTAAHCALSGAGNDVYLTFNQYGFGPYLHGRIHPNPIFWSLNGYATDRIRNDVSVVVLDSSAVGITPAALFYHG